MRDIFITKPYISTVKKENRKSYQKAQITHAVDDKRFIPRDNIRVILKIKANEEVRTKPDALPANKHNQWTIGEHEQKHRA